MKYLTFISSAALVHLAAGQSTPVAPPASTATVFFTDGKPSATWSAPASGSTGNSGAAICGQGFTYCGYILRDHQNFREEDIVRVYCASAKDNCANGKTKSDPLQALYVCLPPQSQAIPVPNDLDSYDSSPPDSKDTHMPLQPHAQNNPGNGNGNGNNGNYNKNVHGLRNRRQAAAPISPVAAAPSSPGGLTSGGSGTCSSTPTTGNQLALLCSCGNKCLNPKEDHIGRCDTPCSQ